MNQKRQPTTTGARLSAGGRAGLCAVVVALALPVACTKQDRNAEANWQQYYVQTEDRAPRPLLLEALELFDREGHQVRGAVDAGCGSGVETMYMLSRGLHVHAFDPEPQAIHDLKSRVPARYRSRLRAEIAPFHRADWDQGVDLVFAGYSLPFASSEHFDESWARITGAIAPGGRFAGHFFGPRDDWASLPDRIHLGRDEVVALFGDDFEIEKLEELEEDRATADGTPKHWHIFHVIARKADRRAPALSWVPRPAYSLSE